MQIDPNDMIGRYRIIKKLGEGGWGTVYMGYDPHLEIQVAIKVLKPSLFEHGDPKRDFKQRFIRGAKILAKLVHSNIVGIKDLIVDEEEKLFAIVMEYVPGGTLKKFIDSTDTSSLQKKIECFLLVCDAIAYAHDKGIIHRDIKPENILLTDKDEPKISDFDTAKLGIRDPDVTKIEADGVMTVLEEVIYSPKYASPEHVHSLLFTDHRSDIFSLGIILYELLTGTHPFPNFHGNLNVHDQFTPPSKIRKNLPKKFDKVLAKALAKNPDDRYQECREMLSDVIEAARDTRTEWKTIVPGIVLPPPQATPHRFWKITVIALVPIIGLSVLAWQTNVFKEIPVLFTEKGTIVLSTYYGSRVSIDDQSPFEIVRSPHEIELDVGAHRIRVLHPDYQGSFIRKVTVSKDRTDSLNVVLEPKPAKLLVDSDPQGSDVYIDGDKVGVTPFEQVMAIPDGDRSIRVQCKNIKYTDFLDRKVLLNPNIKVKVGLDAGQYPYVFKVPVPEPPTQGTLVVESQPPATVIVRGSRRGRTPQRVKLDTGSHRVILETDRGSRWETTVSIRKDRTTPISHTFPASLTIRATPFGYVYIDSDSLGPTPIEGRSFEPGDHQLEIRKSAYITHVANITLSPDKEYSPPPIILKRQGEETGSGD